MPDARHMHLIADDDKITCLIVERLLTRDGCTVGRNSVGEFEGLYWADPPEGQGWIEGQRIRDAQGNPWTLWLRFRREFRREFRPEFVSDLVPIDRPRPRGRLVGAKVRSKVSASLPNIPPAPRENSGGSRSAMFPPPVIKIAPMRC